MKSVRTTANKLVTEKLSYKEMTMPSVEVVLPNGLDNKGKPQNTITVFGWKPIEDYFKEKGKYDWVLVKYFDGDFECVPEVMEYRELSDGKSGWYNKDDKLLNSCFNVKYFFSIKQLDGEVE